MKFIIALSLISFSFFASAESTTQNFEQSSSIEASIAGPGKKSKAKRARRTNRKRKRKCAKFGRRSFAG